LMSRGTLDAEDAFDGLLVQDREPEASSHMRKLLVFRPFDIIDGSLVVRVMVDRLGLDLRLEVDLLGLREPCACGLPPAMVEVEEHVVKVLIAVTGRSVLPEMRRGI